MALLATIVVTGAAMMKDPFLGKWKITATNDDASKELKDVLTFKGGKMTAQELEKKGWPPADYDEDPRPGGLAQFTCTLKHDTEGTMKWQGTIAASEIRGTIEWKKKDGKEDTYNFTGTKN
jgi:hypothetical protein